MKQALQNLLADGKTKQVLDKLRQIKLADTDLNAEVVQLSARFSQYERQKRMGLEESSVLLLELNKINHALLSVIDRLDDIDSQPVKTQSKKTLEIILNGDFGNFERDRFEAVLSAYLRIPLSSIRILQVVQGSIRITIELPSEKVEELIFIFNNDKQKLHILENQLAANNIAQKILKISYTNNDMTLKQKEDFSWTKWTGLNDVKSWIAAFAGIAGILTFYFRTCKEESKYINVSVYVEDKKSDLVSALKKEGHVLMTTEGGGHPKALIDDNSMAAFQNIKIGDKVRLNVDFSEPYRPLNPDSVYTIPTDGRITLTVGLQNLNRVFGTVLYRDHFLEGVLIDVEGLRDTTDLTGRFEIFIPENQQHQSPEVKFIKKGFKDKIVKSYPQTKEPLNIVMEK